MPEARPLTNADLDAMVARELDGEVSECPCGCGTKILNGLVAGKSGQSYLVQLGGGCCGVDGFCIRPAYSDERMIDGRIGALALKHLIEFDEKLFRAVADQPVSTANVMQGVGLRGQITPLALDALRARQREELQRLTEPSENWWTILAIAPMPPPPDDPPQR